MPYNLNRRHSGFTLIEMIIGIVAFAVAMTMMISVIAPQAKQSIDPVFQIRASKLAATLINEIQSKAYDEHSNPTQNMKRCNEDGPNCTLAAAFGPEEGSRDKYDDVDDYHGMSISADMLDSNETYQSKYVGFSLAVSVVYDGDFNGVADNIQNAKLIRVDVTTPNSDVLEFAIYRSNY